MNACIFFLLKKNKKVRYKFSPAVSGLNISSHPLVKEADIIHLHWINHGFLFSEKFRTTISVKQTYSLDYA